MTELIQGGVQRYCYKQNGKHIIGKKITITDLKAIPAGYGGHIGVIPLCNVDDNIYHILCNIYWQKGEQHGNVIGNLGGGVKRDQKPYHALYKELQEEVPAWHDILKSQIEHSDITIYSIEYLHITHHSLRYAITIFVNITPFIKVMNDIFIPSREIKEVIAYCNIVEEVLTNDNINYGLRHYREYLLYGIISSNAGSISSNA